MAHFPRHEPPRFKLCRDQPLPEKERYKVYREMHQRINKERQVDSGLWWTEQRFVDQVAPSECVHPDFFDTMHYRYQVFARPPPILCSPRTMAEASDQPFPVRYNVKRIARDKPLPGEDPCWSRRGPKLVIIPRACPRTEDCSKNNNGKAIGQGSTYGQIDNIRVLPRETTRRMGPEDGACPVDINQLPPRKMNFKNCIRNNWTIDREKSGKNLSPNQNTKKDLPYANCQSPINQMRPKSWGKDLSDNQNTKKDLPYAPCQSPINQMCPNSRDKSFSDNQDTKNVNDLPYAHCQYPTDQMYSKSQDHNSQTISKSVSRVDNLWPGSSRSSCSPSLASSRSSCSNHIGELKQNNKRLEQSHQHNISPACMESHHTPRGKHLVVESQPLQANSTGSFGRETPTNRTQGRKCLPPIRTVSKKHIESNNFQDDYTEREMNNNSNYRSGRPTRSEGYGTSTSMAKDDRYDEEILETEGSFDNLIFQDDDELMGLWLSPCEDAIEYEQSLDLLDLLPCCPGMHSRCEVTFLCKNNSANSDQMDMDMTGKHCQGQEPLPRPPAPTPKRSHCGRLIFSHTASCPLPTSHVPSPYAPLESPPISTQGTTEDVMKQSTNKQTAAITPGDKSQGYRTLTKCIYKSSHPEATDPRTLPRPKTPEIGYNTYKIIGSKQYCPPQQEDVLSNMKMPPHLAEYREFTRRCPNFHVGRYDRLDPANEMLLPSHRHALSIKSSLTPFIFTKNPKHGKYPPLFHQPVNTDTLQWRLPSFVNQGQ